MAASSRESSVTELGAFTQALWRRRLFVVEATIVALLLGLAAHLLLPRQYRAVARMAVTQTHMLESPTGDDGRETFEALQSTRATYTLLIESATVAERIVEEFDLEDELDLNAELLLDRVSVGLLANSALLSISVELPDPEIAAAVAIAFAEHGLTISRQINADAQQRSTELLTTQLQAAEEELDRLEGTISRPELEGGAPTARMQRIQAEFETALQVRAELAQRLKTSAITVASQIGELVMVDEPVVPQEPSSPGAVTTIAGAGLIGLLLALLAAGVLAGLEATAPIDEE